MKGTLALLGFSLWHVKLPQVVTGKKSFNLSKPLSFLDRCLEVHHHCECNCFWCCTFAILGTLLWLCHGGILQRQWQTCSYHLWWFIKAGRLEVKNNSVYKAFRNEPGKLEQVLILYNEYRVTDKQLYNSLHIPFYTPFYIPYSFALSFFLT